MFLPKENHVPFGLLTYFLAYSCNLPHCHVSLPQIPIYIDFSFLFFFLKKNLIGIFNVFFGEEWAEFPFVSKNNEKENKV